MRNRRQQIAMLAVLAAVAAAVLLFVHPWAAEAPAANPPGSPAAALSLGSRAGSAQAPAPLPSDLAELVAYLRGRFGKHIDNPYVQIQMLEKLMRHFQAK